MKLELKRELVRPLLPFSLACLLLAVLLCVLSQATEMERGVSAAARAQMVNRLGSFDYQTDVSVCQQTENLVPNPDFERNGQPWTEHWYEGGVCAFTYVTPGHRSEVAAQILTGSPRDDDCMLFTPILDIPVEGGRSYDYSAWVKAKLSEGSAYLRITFWSREDGGYQGTAQTTSVADTHGEWVRVTGSATPTVDTNYARVEAVLPASSVGWVQFDDIFLGLATCLEITKSVDPPTATRGELLTYTIVYSNTGREQATDVEIIDTYDDYVRFQGADPKPLTGTKGTWKMPVLLDGISGTIEITVTVDDDTGDRAYLFNDFQILSDETLKPVYRTITTPLSPPPDGCEIVPYLPIAEQLAEPGDRIDYDLVLHNAGSHDGEADLIAVSSQGWDLDFTPEPPYGNMSSGSSEEVVVSLFVPPDEPGGTVDVMLITATLTCDPPCTETATATALITTTVVPISLTNVTIDGPSMGHISTTYAFTASISPVTANRPITYIWRATGQEEVTTTTDAPSHTVLFTWGTTGTKTIVVTATNVLNTVTGTPHVITVTPRIAEVFLPLILRNWPPMPPQLYPIDNVDIDGDYDVCWSAVAPTGYHYVLEEFTNSACTGATPVYTGANTCRSFTDRDAGWYYYHVRVCDSSQCFWPSNCEGVGAWWEQEDNDSPLPPPPTNPNGPLISCKDYHGRHDDVRDWFSVGSLGDGDQITMKLGTGRRTDVQLQLWAHWSGYEGVCRVKSPPYEITCDVEKAGMYYVCVKAGSNWGSDTYTLHVAFP